MKATQTEIQLPYLQPTARSRKSLLFRLFPAILIRRCSQLKYIHIKTSPITSRFLCNTIVTMLPWHCRERFHHVIDALRGSASSSPFCFAFRLAFFRSWFFSGSFDELGLEPLGSSAYMEYIGLLKLVGWKDKITGRYLVTAIWCRKSYLTCYTVPVYWYQPIQLDQVYQWCCIPLFM